MLSLALFFGLLLSFVSSRCDRVVMAVTGPERWARMEDVEEEVQEVGGKCLVWTCLLAVQAGGQAVGSGWVQHQQQQSGQCGERETTSDGTFSSLMLQCRILCRPSSGQDRLRRLTETGEACTARRAVRPRICRVWALAVAVGRVGNGRDVGRVWLW